MVSYTLHHQYADPGITNIYKAVHAFFTFMVAVPSLITAFTVAASLEYAGRQRGGKGLFGWWIKISGIVNASYNMNQVVRNTSWIPGHFHLTVGSAFFLTFLGLSLYLLNKLFGKKIFSNTLGVLSAYMWLIGVLIFSWGMMQIGRAGIGYSGGGRNYYVHLLGDFPDKLPWNPVQEERRKCGGG